MLAEWPDTVTELAINRSAVAVAEHATKQEFNKLSEEEVKVKIACAVAKTAVKYDTFRTMQLSQPVIRELERLNDNRGDQKHPYRWEHLKETGYKGNFYRVDSC